MDVLQLSTTRKPAHRLSDRTWSLSVRLAQVKAIDNDATEELQRSVAEASRVVSFAAASATAKVDEARSLGQQYLYEKLNFTRAAHRASFDYLRTMKGLNHLQLAVGFDSLRINGGT